MYLVKYTKYSNVIMPIFSCYVVNFSLFEEMYGVRYGKRTVRYGTVRVRQNFKSTVRYGTAKTAYGRTLIEVERERGQLDYVAYILLLKFGEEFTQIVAAIEGERERGQLN